jgi:hypothetical protein
MSTTPISPAKSILKKSNSSINTCSSSNDTSENTTANQRIHNVKNKPPSTSLLATISKILGMYMLFICFSSKYNEHFKNKINNNYNIININHDISSSLPPPSSSSTQISKDEANLLTIKNKEELIKKNEKVKEMLTMFNMNIPTESFSMPVFPTHDDNGNEYGEF